MRKHGVITVNGRTGDASDAEEIAEHIKQALQSQLDSQTPKLYPSASTTNQSAAQSFPALDAQKESRSRPLERKLRRLGIRFEIELFRQ